MTCHDFDALLCDYLDSTLPSDHRLLMEVHLAECADCSELVQAAREVSGLVERSAEVELPPELVTKILHQVPQGGWIAQLSSRFLSPVLQPFTQPRFVMGAMLTLLSFSMMTRCAGVPKHALTAADVDPVHLWTIFDNKIHRGWQRSVKAYESMKLVYEVQSRVDEWKEQQQEDEGDAHRLPKGKSGANPPSGKTEQ